MTYMLLIYTDENSWTDEQRQRCYAESVELTHDLVARGQYVAASPLQPVAAARSVRVREGKPLVTDGPFAETREQLGGYFLVEATDLNEAIAIAGRIPGARKGTVEVRPVLEQAGLPTPQLGRSRRMRFMLLCYDDEQHWAQAGDAASQKAIAEAVALTHQLDAKGQYVLAAPLDRVSTATSVRVRNGKQLVTDGPFAETREVLGGFYIIDVSDLDMAIGIAQQHSGVHAGTVEVRPIMEITGLPTTATTAS